MILPNTYFSRIQLQCEMTAKDVAYLRLSDCKQSLPLALFLQASSSSWLLSVKSSSVVDFTRDALKVPPDGFDFSFVHFVRIVISNSLDYVPFRVGRSKCFQEQQFRSINGFILPYLNFFSPFNWFMLPHLSFFSSAPALFITSGDFVFVLPSRILGSWIVKILCVLELHIFS